MFMCFDIGIINVNGLVCVEIDRLRHDLMC